MSTNRRLRYSVALNEALHQLMAADPGVFLIGQGVRSPWYVGNTCEGLSERFGTGRVIDTPVSENAITGAGVGAAITGMRPVVVHPRMDFMFYAFDPIINEAANWSYMNGGRTSVPVVFWAIINRGAEQGAQHSQAIHGMFAHVPGLKVVVPSTAYDAKGLMISAVRDSNPVVFVDDRWLYGVEDEVPEEMFEVPLGRGIVRKEGRDVSIVGVSYMARLAMEASAILEGEGIDAEVIDIRCIKPLDRELILNSVKKTRRVVIADIGWKSFGVSAELSATISENVLGFLDAPVVRLALPDSPAPASSALEDVYYPKAHHIAEAARQAVRCKREGK